MRFASGQVLGAAVKDERDAATHKQPPEQPKIVAHLFRQGRPKRNTFCTSRHRNRPFLALLP